MLLTVMEYFRT